MYVYVFHSDERLKACFISNGCLNVSTVWRHRINAVCSADVLMCCLLKSIKSYWVSEILVKDTQICVYIQRSPDVIGPQADFIFSRTNSTRCLYLLISSIKKWRKVAASIEREKSSAQGVTAVMLMQHGMISLRSSSSLWGLDHFFIPLKATLQSWKKHQLLIYIWPIWV